MNTLRACVWGVFLFGCSSSEPNLLEDMPASLNDMSVLVNFPKPDLSDLASADGDNTDLSIVYTATTPYQVDTNTLSKGMPVSMTGLIVLAPPTGFSAKVKVTGDGCRFEVWAQDPSCTTPPCGIVLETAAILNPGGAGAFCAPSYADGTLLKGVTSGEKLDVKGVINTFASTNNGATVVQHAIDLDAVTITDTNQALPASTIVTDTNPSLFVPYSGTGWATYEGMYITLKPPSGKFTTTLDAFGGWFCAPGGAHYTDTYTGFFRPDGAAANMWPPNGSMFVAISGIVSLTFGGGILPTDYAEFEP